jgi:hypothetical protein
MLNDAKYGEHVMEAKELAYQCLVKDGMAAAQYMKDAVADSQDSGADDVGTGAGDESDTTDESDEMAAVVNKKSGR